MDNKSYYNKLIGMNPTTLHTFTNVFGQNLSLVEHPTKGDSVEIIVVSHDLKEAYDSEFYDVESLMQDEYQPYIYNGELCHGGDEDLDFKIYTIEELEDFTICYLYDNNDKFIGEIENGVVLSKVCLDIKQNGFNGWYIKIFGGDGEKILIDSNGSLLTEKKPFTAVGNILRGLL